MTPTPVGTTLPWFRGDLRDGEVIVRLLIAEGTHEGDSGAGACIVLAHPERGMRIKHLFVASDCRVDDEWADLTLEQSCVISSSIERSMRRAEVTTIVRNAARAVAALDALAVRFEADRAG